MRITRQLPLDSASVVGRSPQAISKWVAQGIADRRSEAVRARLGEVLRLDCQVRVGYIAGGNGCYVKWGLLQESPKKDWRCHKQFGDAMNAAPCRRDAGHGNQMPKTRVVWARRRSWWRTDR